MRDSDPLPAYWHGMGYHQSAESHLWMRNTWFRPSFEPFPKANRDDCANRILIQSLFREANVRTLHRQRRSPHRAGKSSTHPDQRHNDPASLQDHTTKPCGHRDRIYGRDRQLETRMMYQFHPEQEEHPILHEMQWQVIGSRKYSVHKTICP